MNQDSRHPVPVQDSESQRACAPAVDRQLLTRLLEDIGGDSESLAELLREYVDDALRLVQAMRRGLTDDDTAAIGMAAHTLKSTSASVGALPLAALCAELSHQTRGESPVSRPALISQIAAEQARVHELLSGSPSAPGQGIDIEALFRRIS